MALKIYRTAKLLVEEHGASAPLQAAQRADELLDEGDIDGSMYWGQIHEVIEEITLELVQRSARCTQPHGTEVQWCAEAPSHSFYCLKRR
jgi:hypothetical protein